MKYRPMTIGDIPSIVGLYESHVRELNQPYPALGPEPDADFARYLMWQMVENQLKNWFAVVAVAGAERHGGKFVGGVPQGVISCVLNARLLEHPQLSGYVEFLAVTPGLRRKGVARKLVQIAARMLFDRGAAVLECAWAPGTLAAELWESMGVRPYRVVGAWVTADGVPRKDLPLIPSADTIQGAKTVPSKGADHDQGQSDRGGDRRSELHEGQSGGADPEPPVQRRNHRQRKRP